ncbi:MAG TPA: hypothetical protein PLT08_09685 [Anaerolineales bacterium]|nr:hypothetical protein [Anaerolineales bacterium]
MSEPISENNIYAKLGLNIPLTERETIIRNLIETHKTDTLFTDGGKCSNVPLQVYPNRYFLAQNFDKKKEDMRNALQEAFDEFNLKVITVDEVIGGALFCNIASLILGTPFGIYHIDKEEKPNVYLELGVSIGLQKPFVLVKDKHTGIASVLEFVQYYEMSDYFSLSETLGNLTNEYITRIGYFDSALMQKASMKTREVCISLGELESVDIGVTLAIQIVKRGYHPVFLCETNKNLAKFLEQKEIEPVFYHKLPEVSNAIARSKFGIYRVDASASSTSFIYLGIAIGLNRPTLMINNEREKPPSDLSIFDALKFAGRTDLEEKFELAFPKWEERFLK